MALGHGPEAGHVQGCDACTRYCAELTAAQAMFREQARPAAFVSAVAERNARRKPAWRWPWAAGVALAAGVGVLVLFVRAPIRPEVRYKGRGLSVVYLRQGMTEPRVVEPSMRLHPNDALRFFYRSDRPGHLAIFERDGRGEASVLHPFAQAQSAPLEQDRVAPLEHSVVLDATPGPEWLVAVFCPKPFLAAAVLAQLHADPPAVSLPGCRVETLRLEKDLP